MIAGSPAHAVAHSGGIDNNRHIIATVIITVVKLGAYALVQVVANVIIMTVVAVLPSSPFRARLINFM